jgi:hypothetical protein
LVCAAGLRGDRHLGEERVRAHLRALGLEMVFGKPERLEPQLLGQDALTDLVDQDFLRGGMHLGKRAVIHRDTILGDDHRKTGRAVVEYTDFEHGLVLPGGDYNYPEITCTLAKFRESKRELFASQTTEGGIFPLYFGLRAPPAV